MNKIVVLAHARGVGIQRKWGRLRHLILLEVIDVGVSVKSYMLVDHFISVRNEISSELTK